MTGTVAARLRRLEAARGGGACRCRTASVYRGVTPEQAAAIERDGPPEERCGRCRRRLHRVYVLLDLDRVVGGRP